MADVLVDLDDRTIHALIHRAEASRRSLNDVMVQILDAAAADEPLPPEDGGNPETPEM